MTEPNPVRLPAPRDATDHHTKRREEFYKYAQSAYERNHQRWTQTDDKAWKYLSILALMLGAGGMSQ